MAGTFLYRMLSQMAAAGLGLLSLVGMVLAQEPDCTMPISLYEMEPLLPRTTAALTSGHPVVIVVLGGASSLGNAAGSPERAWPARLAVALTRHFPSGRVTVVNRAVARQTAQEMAARIDTEVLPAKPALVIWETGTTDAVHGTEPDEFRQTLQTGLDQLRASGAEVVCMDMQFSRHTHVMINFDRYKSVLREVADANEVPLFRRHDLMHHWAEGGLFDYTSDNRDKMQRVASRLYDCLGMAMAEFVTRGIQTGASPPAVPAASQK